MFEAYFNEIFIIGQEKLLCTFFFWSSFFWKGFIIYFRCCDHSALFMQLYYNADQITKSVTQQNGRTLFQCLNRDKRVSDVALSVDTPHRGDLNKMKRRPWCFIMKLLVLWEKAKDPQLSWWLTSF